MDFLGFYCSSSFKLNSSFGRRSTAFFEWPPATATMDKYRRVEKEKKAEDALAVGSNEVRITQQGKVRSYITYANGLFTDKHEKKVVFKAMGHAISKAVKVAEVLKHRIVGLHQLTQISSIETVDVYEPLEEGLDRVEQKRFIPSISIELSLELLDTTNPGYQPPIPAELVSPQIDENDLPARPKKPRPAKGEGKKKEQNDPEKKDPEKKEKKKEKPARASTPAAGGGVATDSKSEAKEKQDVAEGTKEGAAKPKHGGNSKRGGRGKSAGRGEQGEGKENSAAPAVSPRNNNDDLKDDAAPVAAAAAAPKKKGPPRKPKAAIVDEDSGKKKAADRAAETTELASDNNNGPEQVGGRGGRGERGVRSNRSRGRGRGGRGDVEGKEAVAAPPPAPVRAEA